MSLKSILLDTIYKDIHFYIQNFSMLVSLKFLFWRILWYLNSKEYSTYICVLYMLYYYVIKLIQYVLM